MCFWVWYLVLYLSWTHAGITAVHLLKITLSFKESMPSLILLFSSPHFEHQRYSAIIWLCSKVLLSYIGMFASLPLSTLNDTKLFYYFEWKGHFFLFFSFKIIYFPVLALFVYPIQWPFLSPYIWNEVQRLIN